MQFPSASLPVQFAPPPQFTYPGHPQAATSNPTFSPLAPQFTPAAHQQPVLAAQATGFQPEQPKSKIRLQGPDAERSAPAAPRLVMPSPEELGLIAKAQAVPNAQTKEVDLNTVFARLRQLGALGLHLDRLTQGGYRATFVLPGQQGPQQIEADGATEGAALVAALERAETGATRK